jgi:hypothetical protein
MASLTMETEIEGRMKGIKIFPVVVEKRMTLAGILVTVSGCVSSEARLCLFP